MPERGAEERIVGLVRFSYLARSGFSRDFPDLETRQAYLNDPDRLERRFRMFQALALPSLLRQTDPGFRCIFLTGTGLDPLARRRLEDLVAPLSGAAVIALPPLHHYPATQRAFAAVLGEEAAAPRTSFRLDDDDALALGHVARLRRLAAGATAMVGADRPLAIGFHRGLFLELSPDGNALYGVLEKTPPAQGTALVVPAGSDENVFARNHRLLPVFFDCFSTLAAPAFIRTVHRDNDSRPQFTGKRLELTEAEIDASLAQDFGQTRSALMTLQA